MAYPGQNVAYSKDQLRELMELAEDFAENCDLEEFDCLIRDKTNSYFDKIMRRYKGLMRVYAKDCHGDQRCPANGVLDGLYFSPEFDDSNKENSIFGRRRLQIDASALIDSSIRGYFADFYCVPGKRQQRPHYVTIVLARAGSDANDFCRERLVTLQLNNNPLFQVRKSGSSVKVETVTDDHLHVEVFWTEDINIRNLKRGGQANIFDVDLAPYGSEHRNPRSKTPNCDVCNICDDEYDEEDDDFDHGFYHDFNRMSLHW